MKPITEKLDFLQAVIADPDLSAPAKCVMAVLLLRHHRTETGQCNPGLTRIAKGVGRDRRNVVRAIEELRQSCWVEVISTKGGTQANANQYRFDFSHRLAGEEDDTGDEDDTSGEDATGDEYATGTSGEDATAGVAKTVGTSGENAPRTFLNPSLPSGESKGREKNQPRHAPDGAPEREKEEADFVLFWKQYPKHQGEDGARRAFSEALVSGADPKVIEAGAMRYAAERDGKPGKYTASAVNWLRDGRWKDEPSPADEVPEDRGHRRGGRIDAAEDMMRYAASRRRQ